MKALIKEKARSLGFALVGVTMADPVPLADRLREADADGRFGGMDWLARDPEARCDPASLLPGARSVICCALYYGNSGLKTLDLGPGTRDQGPGEQRDLPDPRFQVPGSRVSVARFARGAEYHAEVKRRLGLLWEAIRERAPKARARLCVDTSPILEKALAERAGIGWIGKHTVLVNRELGSWFVLGEIVTDLEIEPDAAHENLCGACERCLESCPTRAIVGPRSLDSRRCISYLTIERPRLDLGPGTGDQGPGIGSPLPGPGSRVPGFECQYGCDICQEACPFNTNSNNQ
jgi:epoxyqueuosine reductase